MYTFVSNKEEDTMNLAEKIASRASAGDIIVLSGELGSGKTKFTQGFLRFFKLDSEISSPTFTIVNEHSANIPIYHFDVYRLADIDEFYAIGGDEYFSKGICLIEWGELVEPILPEEYLKISFSRDDENEHRRILTIEPHGKKFEEILNFIKESSNENTIN